MLHGLEQLLRDGDLGTLTMGEIATRLGCSRRTLYELAPSRDHLMLILVDRVMHRVGERAIAAVDPTAPASVQLRQFLAANPEYTFRSNAFDAIVATPDALRLRETHHRFATTIVERIVATGIDRGEFHHTDPAIAAGAIMAAATHLLLPDVLDDLGRSIEDVMDHLLDLVLRGLLRDPPG